MRRLIGVRVKAVDWAADALQRVNDIVDGDLMRKSEEGTTRARSKCGLREDLQSWPCDAPIDQRCQSKTFTDEYVRDELTT